MLRPVAGFIDRQGTTHQRLGFCQPVGDTQEMRQVVEA